MTNTAAPVSKVARCNLCKEVFMQRQTVRPSPKCSNCLMKRRCPCCQHVMAINAANCPGCGQSMKSLTINSKQKTLKRQFESGEQHKRGNGYTKQRMCNMSAFAHGAGFGVITFMLKPNSLDQLTVISSGVSSEHTKESIEAMKDLLLGSMNHIYNLNEKTSMKHYKKKSAVTRTATATDTEMMSTKSTATPTTTATPTLTTSTTMTATPTPSLERTTATNICSAPLIRPPTEKCSVTPRPSTASTVTSTNRHVVYSTRSTHIDSAITTTLTNTSATASYASVTSQLPPSRNNLLATNGNTRKLWAIEKINRIRGAKALVKWKGYKTPTWEPVRNVKHTIFYQQLMKEDGNFEQPSTT
ncbi:hypothetical protein EB796_008118 [Bugula neritina]|uniref:Chromo domain-containing protein n=1 Tax=Bugula neritina TaxID=10212 RepID=A0A7J7K6I2_BUGNE|nr:hypothetical protein EB796_008118 [Bugula neritina]